MGIAQGRQIIFSQINSQSRGNSDQYSGCSTTDRRSKIIRYHHMIIPCIRPDRLSQNQRGPRGIGNGLIILEPLVSHRRGAAGLHLQFDSATHRSILVRRLAYDVYRNAHTQLSRFTQGTAVIITHPHRVDTCISISRCCNTVGGRRGSVDLHALLEPLIGYVQSIRFHRERSGRAHRHGQIIRLRGDGGALRFLQLI